MGVASRGCLLSLIFSSQSLLVASFGPATGNNLIGHRKVIAISPISRSGVAFTQHQILEPSPLFARNGKDIRVLPKRSGRIRGLLSEVGRRARRRARRIVTAAAFLAAWTGSARFSPPAVVAAEAVVDVAAQPAIDAALVGKTASVLVGAAGAGTVLRRKIADGSANKNVDEGEGEIGEDKFKEIVDQSSVSLGVTAEALMNAAEKMIEEAKKEAEEAKKEAEEARKALDVESVAAAKMAAEEEAAWGRAAAEKAEREMMAAKQAAAEKVQKEMAAKKAAVEKAEKELAAKQAAALKAEAAAKDIEVVSKPAFATESSQRALLAAQLRYTARRKAIKQALPEVDLASTTVEEASPTTAKNIADASLVEANQQALLTAQLQYRRQQAAKKQDLSELAVASATVEKVAPAIVENAADASLAESNQRALLAAQLQYKAHQITKKQDLPVVAKDPKHVEKSDSVIVENAAGASLAEANQRALLTAQLRYSAQENALKQSLSDVVIASTTVEKATPMIVENAADFSSAGRNQRALLTAQLQYSRQQNALKQALIKETEAVVTIEKKLDVEIEKEEKVLKEKEAIRQATEEAVNKETEVKMVPAQEVPSKKAAAATATNEDVAAQLEIEAVSVQLKSEEVAAQFVPGEIAAQLKPEEFNAQLEPVDAVKERRKESKFSLALHTMAKKRQKKRVERARKQPKSPIERVLLSRRYRKMNLEERAFTILVDLGMVELTPDPDDPHYDATYDDDFAPENVWLE